LLFMSEGLLTIRGFCINMLSIVCFYLWFVIILIKMKSAYFFKLKK
jgi:hypothetical protein